MPARMLSAIGEGNISQAAGSRDNPMQNNPVVRRNQVARINRVASSMVSVSSLHSDSPNRHMISAHEIATPQPPTSNPHVSLYGLNLAPPPA